MNEREMYGELNALLGAIGKALDIEAELAARAIEQGEIVIEMSEDDRGERFLWCAIGDGWPRSIKARSATRRSRRLNDGGLERQPAVPIFDLDNPQVPVAFDLPRDIGVGRRLGDRLGPGRLHPGRVAGGGPDLAQNAKPQIAEILFDQNGAGVLIAPCGPKWPKFPATNRCESPPGPRVWP